MGQKLKYEHVTSKVGKSGKIGKEVLLYKVCMLGEILD